MTEAAMWRWRVEQAERERDEWHQAYESADDRAKVAVMRAEAAEARVAILEAALDEAVQLVADALHGALPPSEWNPRARMLLVEHPPLTERAALREQAAPTEPERCPTCWSDDPKVLRFVGTKATATGYAAVPCPNPWHQDQS